jgi:hypothetical protein
MAAVPTPPECLLSDARLIAWAYQIWNEPLRRRNSWAVSHRDAQENESASVEAITQIFTDDYIADFLARCCYKNYLCGRGVQSPIPRVCDPACGAGHLLIAMVRRLVECGQSLDEIGGRLWGFDIDPHVLAVARVALFIEIERGGYRGDLWALWKSLLNSIRLFPTPYGSLDRDVYSHGIPTQFDIVVANPPYLGRRKLPSAARDFLDLHYPAARVDLCAAFIQRCIELASDGGSVGLLTSDKWLRLAGYSSLRNGNGDFPGIFAMLSLDLIVELGERAFHPLAALHDGVKASVFCGRKCAPVQSHHLVIKSLSRDNAYADKVRYLLDFEAEAVSERVLQARLRSEGAGAVMLAASGAPSALLKSTKLVGDYAQVVVGTQTSDDKEYVRYVWQVPPGARGWRVHSKGGGYARWAGLNRWMIDWERGAPSFFKTSKARDLAEAWNERAGWSYTWFANGSLGVRVKESGWSFGRAAASGVFMNDPRLAAYLNSRFASFSSRSIGGKAQLPEGVVRKLPAPDALEQISRELVELAVKLKKEIVRTDMSDALYDPEVMYSLDELFQIEALLLCVEGVLEAQVESALGLTRAESASYAALVGVPVGWFLNDSDELADRVWGVLPAEFSCYKAVLQAALGRVADSCAVAKSSMRKHLGGVLEALKTRSNRSYALGAVSVVEQVARSMELHPFNVVLQLRSGVEGDRQTRRWALLPWIGNQILREILIALGHAWQGKNRGTSSSSVEKIGFDDTCSLIESVLARHSAMDLLDRPLPSWVEKVFIPWQSRLFFGASPLIVGRDPSGRIELSHTWQELVK